jgi:hypothetical protein
MNPRLQSLLGLAVTVAGALATAFSPQIQEFLGHNPWIGPVAATVAAVYNNLVTPIHKA